MKIILNGQSKEFAPTIKLHNLIEEFCKDTHRGVIAEINGTIIKKTQWEKQTLSDGDTIELVRFFGGG